MMSPSVAYLALLRTAAPTCAARLLGARPSHAGSGPVPDGAQSQFTVPSRRISDSRSACRAVSYMRPGGSDHRRWRSRRTLYVWLFGAGSLGLTYALYSRRRHSQAALALTQIANTAEDTLDIYRLHFDAAQSGDYEKFKWAVNNFTTRKAHTAQESALPGVRKCYLFQFQPCPFCCKARAFLDFYGIPYDVVEVNSVVRSQIKWSQSYRKVPILVLEMQDGRFYKLTDSTLIVSTLYSWLRDAKTQSLEEILQCYPHIRYVEEGRKQTEVANRYFIMHGKDDDVSETAAGPQTVTSPKQVAIYTERLWRRWVDDTFLHTISPNVNRTLSEALQSFRWFDQFGQWPSVFSSWERQFVIYSGALVMYLVGWRLKQKYQLKDDVRESLYDAGREWTNQLRAKGKIFMGGQQPDLSDLAMYGCLNSIRGCQAFQDLMFVNERLAEWFHAMDSAMLERRGGENMDCRS